MEHETKESLVPKGIHLHEPFIKQEQEDKVPNSSGYRWIQDDQFVTILMPLEIWIESNSIQAKIEKDYISVGTHHTILPLIQGHPYHEINEGESLWQIDITKGVRILEIKLKKTNASEWPHLMKEDCPIDKLDSHSLYELAVNEELKENHAHSLSLYMEAARKGSIQSHLKLAALYAVEPHERKFELQTNAMESFKYHLRAAELGSHEAEFFVGNSYQFGHGTEINFERSVYWYERFVTAKIPINKFTAIAVFNLGLIYHVGGENFPPDQKMAHKWWLIGSELGDARSIFNLAILYLNGSGVEKDLEKALILFQLADQIDPTLPIPTDIRKALKQAKEMAEAREKELEKEEKKKSSTPPSSSPSTSSTSSSTSSSTLTSTSSKKKKEMKKRVSFKEAEEKESKKNTSLISTWEVAALTVLIGAVVAAFVLRK